MKLATSLRGIGRWHGWARDDGAVLFCFAATLFASALLLFSVQPMFAKLVLPKLGGSPSVWAVSMCFFQAMLLAGYGYAYILNRYLDDRRAVMVHLSLLAATCLALPFGLPAAFAEPPAGDAYAWLIGLLVAGVGLPFFAIAGNAPLLQAWFSRTGHPHANDPYFLYRASNIGSLIALLAYPLVLEPNLGLLAQSRYWSYGFFALGAMIAICGGLLLVNVVRPQTSVVAAKNEVADANPVTWQQRSGWVMLSFLPSGLIVAVTTYISTDVASAPFLWVIPLALFLLTFVLVFRERLPFNYGWLCEAVPAAILAMVMTQSLLISSVFALLAFFLGSLVCHRELYKRRPSSAHLTEFYLWMSFGGVLGGIFSALIAPHLFNSVFEFPLLVLLTLLCRPGIVFERTEPLSWSRVGLIVAAGLALMGSYKLAVYMSFLSSDRIYLVVLIAAVCFGLFQIRRWPEHRAAMVLTMIAGAALAPTDVFTMHVERSFFGTHRVLVSDDGSTRMLLHGTTIHGAEILRDDAGKPIENPVPATYYHPAGPMARGVAAARAGVTAHGKPLRVGVVGLGTGSLACYAQTGEAWRYFEIDPAVARIATDARLFSFLSRCQPHADIVIGDARLTLGKEPASSFGYLVIDAFSSDSIPVHLLTSEAIQMFVSKIDENGLLALHVSNRHLDLIPALASTIAQIPGLTAVLIQDQRPQAGLSATGSQVIVIARKPASLAVAMSWPDATPLIAGSAQAWTDDYSDVLSALIRKLRD